MYCLWYQTFFELCIIINRRDTSSFIIQLVPYSDIIFLQDLDKLKVKISYKLSYHTVSSTKFYVISYDYELCKITSILCTFFVNNAASTMASLTLGNGLFVWISILTASKTYIQYCPFKLYFTNNEPGNTIHILYKISIFRLLVIRVINKLGVHYYKRFFSKRLQHMLATIYYILPKENCKLNRVILPY